MTCRFLEDFSLATLVAPRAETEFAATHWEKRPLIVDRRNARFYDDLFTLDDFDQAIAAAPDQVKIAEGKTKSAARIEVGTSSRNLERVIQEMRDGATLILDSLHKRDAKLGLLCRLLEQELGHRFQTNVYLTPPSGQGFAPHFDGHDVFVLQIMGAKHWRIEKRRRAVPIVWDGSEATNLDMDEDVESFTLAQGDMVYIPRGFVHAAECGTEPSLHITLGMNPTTWADLLRAAIKAKTIESGGSNRALPLGFMRGDNHALAAEARSLLMELVDESFLARVVEQFADELVTTFPLDVSGQVAAFYQASGLALDDRVGPRPGMVHRMHVEGDAVRVRLGARVITFPGFLAEPLAYALDTKVYAIRSIPGDLEDGEKLVFVERLMQEGLVVAKPAG